MGKLFELLAVETHLGDKARGVLGKVKERFGDPQSYLGQRRTYRPLIDGGQPFPEEHKELPDTVKADLDLLFTSFGQWLDASIQKEVTNQGTSADVEIENEVLLQGLPATALLNLENKLAELGKVLKAIPTNDVAQKWEFDDQVGAYISRPRITFRTEKIIKTHIRYEATDHHPAQTEVYNTDDRVGEWTTIIQSGMLQPAEKRKLVERCEALMLAVKKGRQRANDIEQIDIRISSVLISYLRG